MIVAIAAQFAAIEGKEAQRDANNDTEDILRFKAKYKHGIHFVVDLLLSNTEERGSLLCREAGWVSGVLFFVLFGGWSQLP
jgi:hypothetical protein